MATLGLRVWTMGLAMLLLPVFADQRASAATAPAAVTGTLTGSGYVNPGQRPLKSAMPLQPGDQIVLRHGKLAIRMADGTAIRLAGPAEFTVETPRDAAGRSVFQATAGRVLVNTRQAKGGEVRLVTPSATLAVRGSTAGADVSPTASLMWCEQGLVYVSAAGEEVPLRPGYETYVEQGSAPPPGTPMSPETHALNQILSLEASLSQNEGTVVVGGPATGSTASPEEQRMAEAERVVTDLFKAYSSEELSKMEQLVHDDFVTNDVPGMTRNRADILLSCSADFQKLDNIHFVLQPATVRRFYADSDQVSLRIRWVLDALLSTGTRMQQGGETLFVVGADMRVLRWEGDLPFGRFKPEPGANNDTYVATPTVFTPPPGDAPEVIVFQGDASVGSAGINLANSTAHIYAAGTLIQTAAAQGGGVQVGMTGVVTASNAFFTVNGAQVVASSVTIQNTSTLVASDVQLMAGGSRIQAATLTIAGGTVQFQNAVITDAQGNLITLLTGTINVDASGNVVFSGVTDAGQTITSAGGQVIYEPPPGTPLLAGRGERVNEGQGFNFATSAVTAGPSDLFITGGRLDLDGLAADLGVVDFASVVVAPPAGYTKDLIPLESLVPGQVLVVQLAGGGYAKILVRSGTSASQLAFDWVYNNEGPALTRGKRWPSRAAVTFDAKVYSRSASGHQRFLRSTAESIVEFRAESVRNLSNGASVEAYVAPRLSTDRQSDSKTAIVDRFGLRYFMPNQFEITFGDVSSEFTPYTLNQTVLGLAAWRNFSIGPAGTARLMTALGPRWRPGSAFRLDGWITGVRLATDELRDLGPYIEDMVVGVNLVKSYRGKRQQNNYLSSTVASVDASIRLKSGLGLMAEVARSFATDGRAQTRGDAVLLRAAYRWGPMRFIVDRERVGTGFTTVSGTAAVDQERTNLWVRYRPAEWLSANLNFLHSRDNLSGTKPYTTEMDMPRYGLSISPFYPLLREGFLRNLTLDFLVRQTQRASDDDARTVDRKARTISVSLIQRMGDFFLTVGRDSIRDLDFKPTGLSRRGNALDVSLRWRPRGTFLNVPVSPIVGYRYGRDEISGGPSGPVTSKLRGQRFGLELGTEDWLAVELGYELLDNRRTDLGGYDRRILNVDLTRALDREGNRMARLSYRFSNNEQENGARSFSEGQLTGSVSQRF